MENRLFSYSAAAAKEGKIDIFEGENMKARIFQEPKNAMQSGRARTQVWLLEFAPIEARSPDPLMGWAGSGDTRRQLRFSFPSLDEAKAYAARNGIDADIVPTPVRRLKLQTYADNFR